MSEGSLYQHKLFLCSAEGDPAGYLKQGLPNLSTPQPPQSTDLWPGTLSANTQSMLQNMLKKQNKKKTILFTIQQSLHSVCINAV